MKELGAEVGGGLIIHHGLIILILYCNKTLQSDWSVRGELKPLIPPLIQLIPPLERWYK